MSVTITVRNVTLLPSFASTAPFLYGNQQLGSSWDSDSHLSVPWHSEGWKSQPKTNSSIITLLRSVS